MNDDHTGHCTGCGAPVGQCHHLGCDTERCEACGDQRFVCGCTRNDRKGLKRTKVTGLWPGVAECREYGFWCIGGMRGVPYQQCTADTPGAQEDLNRLLIECEWDQQLQKRVPR